MMDIKERIEKTMNFDGGEEDASIRSWCPSFLVRMPLGGVCQLLNLLILMEGLYKEKEQFKTFKANCLTFLFREAFILYQLF